MFLCNVSLQSSVTDRYSNYAVSVIGPFSCAGNNVRYIPDLTDCSKYIECWNGQEFRRQCINGLLWNNENNYCDYPENVNCQ